MRHADPNPRRASGRRSGLAILAGTGEQVGQKIERLDQLGIPQFEKTTSRCTWLTGGDQRDLVAAHGEGGRLRRVQFDPGALQLLARGFFQGELT